MKILSGGMSLAVTAMIAIAATAADKDVEFFETKIRPVLAEQCYRCHSAEAKEIKGGLRLDLKAGWQAGGDSGDPAIVPGKPDESPLLQAVRHADGIDAMPPNQARLSDAVIADLTQWIKNGASDPRVGKLTARAPAADWEALYEQRLQWWSLQPIKTAAVPVVVGDQWSRNEVDCFILRDLRAAGLQPAREAERRTLARRLSFTLTGLPPKLAEVERFVADDSPAAYDTLVQSLLASPHFGEHWARHWMDVVHYSDTHGYEWDTPAKNAWRYRDYLIRAFNADVPFSRLILEQIAGDLLDPRVDDATGYSRQQTGVNEALIAPMALRLGERRHGDNAQSEGVTQETIANMVDTVSKGFLGTTVACARCHDHKLDAISQRDYYSLAGVFMSTRWHARTIDAVDPNVPVLTELREVKQQIRAELARLWLAERDQWMAKLTTLPANEKAANSFPQSLADFWQREEIKPLTADEFAAERERRSSANRANLRLVADFTGETADHGWQVDGSGLQRGLARDGDLVIADEGDEVVFQIVPAGRWSHLWSMRLAGALRSPQFPPKSTPTLSVGFAGGKHVAHSMIIDQAFHCERMKFENQPKPGWLTVTAGNFDSLEGSIDGASRRVHFEVVTKSLNNYFPPRTGYGGVSEKEEKDDRSWFGVTKVFEHPAGKPPQDELARFAPLYADPPSEEAAARRQRFVNLIQSAVERWSRDACTSEDALLLDDALRAKLLTNNAAASASLKKLLDAYRTVEKRLQPDQTVGSAAEWNEGENERIGVRGSYTEFGEQVPRGKIRFLNELSADQPALERSSGRLQLAHLIANEKNPLTARVYVNRVWQHLFGFGLVRTPDDFGHLGERPTHPELLDYLADRFMLEGWSTKKLIRLLVSSAVWQQSSQADQRALAVDPENRLWHHWPLRRLEAESIRDSLLVSSGRFDNRLFGPPIDPYRTAEDPMKRLLRGPLDGQGRRSIYLKMTLMEPPRFLALFNQPIPLLTVGKRDVTNVPDQALALLNDPFVVAMAQHWAERLVKDDSQTPEQRAGCMLAIAFSRPATDGEVDRLVRLTRRSAELRGISADSLLKTPAVWQDAAHALFNLKEFIYVQ